MQIKYHGQSCFALKEGEFSVVTDPEAGADASKSNVVTISRPSIAFKAEDPKVKLFNWPGEYETGGVYFVGVPTFHNVKESTNQEDNTAFKIEMGSLRICHLGRLGTKLTPEQLEAIGDVDVLFVPIGGGETVEAKKAKEVIEQIEPRIMIPMMFDEESLTSFLKEMGAISAERLDMLSVKRSELPEEMSKVVVLRPS